MVSGSGGGPPSPIPSCIQTAEDGCIDPPAYETARQEIENVHAGQTEFLNQWGLSTIKADRAYAQLELQRGAGTAPGAGQTVGVIDSGIDQSHPMFAGKTVSETFLDSATDEDGTRFSHGTAVASVIAAIRDPDRRRFSIRTSYDPSHGVAWGADIAMFAIPVASSGGTYVPVLPTTLSVLDDSFASMLNQVIGWSSGGRSIDFVNLSFGLHGIVDLYSEQLLRANLDNVIATLAQATADEKTIFVWSAGNANGDDCESIDFPNNPDLCVNGKVVAKSTNILSGMTARIAEVRKVMVAVAAVGEDGSIASFSNRCGIVAEWCLAAPGVNVRVAYFGPTSDGEVAWTSWVADGTSFAAPMVTGALVVMKHFFRDQLSNTELLARLLETANDRGIYADSSVYGRGLLNLAAATAPVGVTTVALGNRVDGFGVALSQSGISLGNALGDGLALALAGQEIAVFDELGAPFWYSLGGLAHAADGLSREERLRRFMLSASADRQVGIWRPTLGAVESGDRPAGAARPLQLRLLDAPSQGADGGHLSLAGPALAFDATGEGELEVAAFSSEGLGRAAPVSGGVLSWRPDAGPLSLRGGWVGERASLLGSRTAGAFGGVTAGAAFAGVNAQASAGPWRLGAGAEIGTVDASAEGGLIADISPLTTSAYSLQAERPLADDGALSFSLSQPLRVEAGEARLSVPVGRTRDRQVRRRWATAALEPSGRQIEIAAAWRRPVQPGGAVSLGAVWTRHPGHDATAAPDLTLLAGWRQGF